MKKLISLMKLKHINSLRTPDLSAKILNSWAFSIMHLLFYRLKNKRAHLMHLQIKSQSITDQMKLHTYGTNPISQGLLLFSLSFEWLLWGFKATRCHSASCVLKTQKLQIFFSTNEVKKVRPKALLDISNIKHEQWLCSISHYRASKHPETEVTK